MAKAAENQKVRLRWRPETHQVVNSTSRHRTDNAVRWRNQRFGGVGVFLALFMVMSMLTRLALAVRAADKVAWDWTLMAALVLGVFFDLVAGGLAAIPITLYLAVAPERIWANRVHRVGVYLAGLALTYGLVIVIAAEWLFWTEFEARFNFIAIDYLVYTEEILGNIRESYPTSWILVGLAAVAVVVWLAVLWTKGATNWLKAQTPVRSRLLAAIPLIVLPVATVAVVEQSDIPVFANNFNRELAKNGLFSLFAAFQANHLEYERFYTTHDRAAVFERLHHLLEEPHASLIPGGRDTVARHMTGRSGDERHYNVIQITVESLSASFMTRFGNTRGLTPNLDRIASEGLLFTNFYATGTRTTRGMEALTLSLPPTPGRSIVHRENNADLFTLGSVLRSRGYDTAFLYGGYGYFDHMNSFFSGNGYRVVDRSAMDAAEVNFATIWGACDEDLLRWTLAEADCDSAAGIPFHLFVMTTSNHRPYAYPDGRIDIPSKTGRDGAVKYTDYAIGHFIEEARTRPWFADTIFVIVADHCASSAGKAELTVSKYRIPMIFYNPGLIEPGEVNVLSSQVDYPPTLLAFLGWSYDSLFFGRDILATEQNAGRAFIGNYQTLGLLTEDRLQILKPNLENQTFRVDRTSGAVTPVGLNPEFLNDAVAFYQGAAMLFTEGRFLERPVAH